MKKAQTKLNPPRKIWQAFESPAGLARSRADWRRLGPDYDALETFLRAKKGLAAVVPCPATSFCGCDHAIVEHSKDDIVAVCQCVPQRCPTVSIQRTDAAIFEVNPDILAESLAQVLGAKPTYTAVNDLRFTWQFGTYSPGKADGIAFYLTIQTDPEDMRQVAEGLVVRVERPFVLFAPTDIYWSLVSDEVLRRHNARFIALSDILAWNGKMTVRQPIETLLCDFLKQMLPSDAEETVFRREGDVWRVVYDGTTVSLLHTTGLAYIHELMRNQGQEMHASTLQAATAGMLPSTKGNADELQASEDGEEYTEGNRRRKNIPAGNLLDEQAREEYISRMDDIDGELREAESNNDTGRIQSLKQELNQLSEELGRGTGLGGRLRNNDDAERARKAVSIAIYRAYTAIKKKHPSFEQHLRRSISIAEYLSYRPEKPIAWVT